MVAFANEQPRWPEKILIAMVRGRLLRSVKRVGKDDPLRELERAFQQLISWLLSDLAC